MSINKFLSYAVLITLGFLQLSGLSAVDLKTMAQRQSFKQKVLADIKKGNWIAAAKGIEQFQDSNLKRFAIDLRQAFANAHSKPGALPADWPSSLKKSAERQQAKAAIIKALDSGHFTTALAGIQKLPEASRRNLYTQFVTAAANFKSKGLIPEDLSDFLAVWEETPPDEPGHGSDPIDDPDEWIDLVFSADDEYEGEYEGEDEGEGNLFTIAASTGNVELIKQFLNQDESKLNSTNETGATALIEASKNNKMEVLRILLLRKADPDIKDNTGRTAHDYATEFGYEGVIQLLHNPPSNNPFKRSNQELDI